MADNFIEIALRFLVDKKSQAEAQKAISEIGKSGNSPAATVQPSANFKETAQEVLLTAKQLKIPIDDAVQSMAGMATGGFKTEAQLRADVQAFQAMEAEADTTAQAVQAIDKNVQGMNRSIKVGQAGMTGFTLMMTGMALQRMGKDMLSPISAYTKYAGETTPASAEWLASNEKLEQSTLRIGAALSQVVAPTMENIAKVAEDVAGLIERYPVIAQAAAGFAGGGIVVGSLLMVGGQIMSSAAAIASLIQMMGGKAALANVGSGLLSAGKTVATAGAAAAGSTATAIGLGVGAGVIGYNAIADALKLQSAGQIMGKTLTTMAYYAGSLFSPSKASAWARSIGTLTGAIDKLGNQADQTSSNLGPGSQAIQAYVDYQDQEAEATRQKEEQRTQIVEDNEQQRLSLESQYESKRSDILSQIANLQGGAGDSESIQSAMRSARDFAQNEIQTEQDYYRNRLKIISDGGIEAERAEEDHQRRMAKLQQDHELKVEDLLTNRDYFGLITEQRNYEVDRQQQEGDYRVEVSRRDEDLARRLAEMDNEFAQERARRLVDFQQRRADEEADRQMRRAAQIKDLQDQLKRLDADHKAELIQLDQQKAEKLNALQKSYNEERIKRQNAFADQIRDLNADLLGERTLRQRYYQAMSVDLENWLKTMQGKIGSNNTGYPTNRRAAGGYASYGYYLLGDNPGGGRGPDEWVMNGQLTRYAERLAGGQLTQGKMMALLAGGNGSGGNVSVNMRVDGRVTAADRRWIHDDVFGALAEALGG